ncbi:hypothetical protein SAMN05660826_01824 [Caldanaerovirga acetigignens]|uniref:DUF6917 domain-containing protein n=1 Tax=Caldanaerovirga acetigignens TaxID=447595 RepID=A0A1M7L8V0_9FIRM|nr:hypothetical protein [Caldanaerovirga acetigignens]SHM74328.1 hypothetical protein SAMN05660826_01824 [Caldanaerovirga acetigignens]
MGDPYKNGMFKGVNPYIRKKPLKGKIIVVLDGKYEERGLKLIVQPSRCIKVGEVHELIITDEAKGPGDIVNRIAYVGFFEAKESAVIVSGDEVKINGRVIGKIAGYDETHMPNHYNIVLNAMELVTGNEMGIELDSEIVIG